MKESKDIPIKFIRIWLVTAITLAAVSYASAADVVSASESTEAKTSFSNPFKGLFRLGGKKNEVQVQEPIANDSLSVESSVNTDTSADITGESQLGNEADKTGTDQAESEVSTKDDKKKGVDFGFFSRWKNKNDNSTKSVSDVASGNQLNVEPVALSLVANDLNLHEINKMVDKIAVQKKIQVDAVNRQGLEYFSQGIDLYRQFKFEDAYDHFHKARQLIPNNPDLITAIEMTKYVLGDGREGYVHTTSNWIGEAKQVQEDEQLLRIRHHIREGQSMIEQAKERWANQQESNRGERQSQALLVLSNARAEMRQALDGANWIGVGTDVQQEKESIRAAINEIEILQTDWNSILESKRNLQAKQRAQDLAKEQADYEAAKLQRLLTQIKKDYINGFYDKSEDLAKRILAEWPNNVEARKIMEKSRRKRDVQTKSWIDEKNEEEWKKGVERIREASITYADSLVYPKNWDHIRLRKPQSIRKVSEPEWQKQLTRQLNMPVTLVLVDNTLDEGVQILQEQTGINIVVDRGLFLEDARVESLRLRNVRFASALKWLLNSIPAEEKLMFTLRDGAVFITSKQRLALVNRPSQILYDVTDLITAFQDFTLDEGTAGLAGAGVGLASVGEGGARESLGTDALIDVIKQNVDTESWSQEEAGISIVEFELGKLLISQTPDNHKMITDLLEMFRKLQTLQISIQVNFISSQDDELLDLGVEWKGFSEVPLLDLGGSASSGTGAFSPRNTTDTDTRMAVVLGSAGDSIPKATRYIPGASGGLGGLAQLAVLDPIRASLVLHAVQERIAVKDSLSPRLTVLNNHQGYFIRSQDTSYVRSYVNDNGLTPIIERISSGELLVVKPTVSSDKKYITMDLSPQITRNVSFQTRTLSIQQAIGDGEQRVLRVVDADVEMPNIQVWQLQTRIQVPDGGVVFIGGRMGNKETNISRGVPLISKIPGLGRLFRTDADGVEISNLLISVRGKILIFDEYEAKL